MWRSFRALRDLVLEEYRILVEVLGKSIEGEPSRRTHPHNPVPIPIVVPHAGPLVRETLPLRRRGYPSSRAWLNGWMLAAAAGSLLALSNAPVRAQCCSMGGPGCGSCCGGFSCCPSRPVCGLGCGSGCCGIGCGPRCGCGIGGFSLFGGGCSQPCGGPICPPALMSPCCARSCSPACGGACSPCGGCGFGSPCGPACVGCGNPCCSIPSCGICGSCGGCGGMLLSDACCPAPPCVGPNCPPTFDPSPGFQPRANPLPPAGGELNEVAPGRPGPAPPKKPPLNGDEKGTHFERQPQGSLDSAERRDLTQCEAPLESAVLHKPVRQRVSAGFHTKILVAGSGRLIAQRGARRPLPEDP